MNSYKNERTFNGVTYQAYMVCEEVSDFVSDYAFGNGLGEFWFPEPEEYGMIADVISDFGKMPEGMPEEKFASFIDALAKHYVGYKPTPVDPYFFDKLEAKYGKYFS